MPITNKVKFANYEKTTESETTSATWVAQGTILDSNLLAANNEYLLVSWVNCISPGSNEGATKLAFADGTTIIGSDQQRHDTNDSGICVSHIGQFIAPDPPQDIQVYRKRLYNGGHAEKTELGQGFVIDLSYSGASGGLVSGTDFSSHADTSVRGGLSNGDTFHTHTVTEPGTNLIFAAAKVLDSVDAVLVGMYVNDVLVASGSHYTQDTQDEKTVVFAGTYEMGSSQTIKLKSLDTDTTVAKYSYSFSLNLGNGPANSGAKEVTNWSDLGGSGTWGSSTLDGNNDSSFVVAMGRQKVESTHSGRMASISLKNNTANEWLIFKDRPSGDFNPRYFPNTNSADDRGQYETSVIVGVSTVGTGDSIEMVTV